jgi:hypothetical protein
VSKLRQRAVFGISAVLLGIVLFDVASAFVIDRKYSPILAAIVGVFAFPVAPLVWHFIGELRRKSAAAAVAAKPAKGAAAPKPSSLTSTDRYWMRFVGVTLLVLGPMAFIGRFDVARAPFRHGLWFVPTPPPDLRDIGSGEPRTFPDHELLLKHLPQEAEFVAVVHDPNVGGNLVAGWTPGKTAIISSGQILLPGGATIADYSRRIAWLGGEAIHEVPTPDDLDALASEAWKTKVQLPGDGPNGAIRRELSRAPQAAQIVTAWVPRAGKDAKAIRGAAAWLVLTEDTVVVEGRLEATNIVAATELYARANGVLVAEHAEKSKDCRKAIETLSDHTTIVQNGTVITMRATTTRDVMGNLVLACAMN